MTGRTGQVPFELEKSVHFRRLSNRPEVEEALFGCAVASTAAHVRMLGATAIAQESQSDQVFQALKALQLELSAGNRLVGESDFDYQKALDRLIEERCGELVSLTRMAKSTNDQLATDLRMWLRGRALELGRSLIALRRTLGELARRDLDIVMPGYTHMQPAEAILLSHWWLACESKFARDFSRLQDFLRRINKLPLGAGVLAGAREPIDRQMVCRLLGFDDVIENSVDAVSDRDFLIEFGAFASLVGVHISQLGSELLLWATQEFAFIWLPRHLTIYSHTLPLKRNPELLEVMRSRPSAIHGRLFEFITQLKALPLGFAQDLQECVPGLSETSDNVQLLLDLSTGVLPGIELDARRMKEVACADLVNVSAAMDYLIARGIDRTTTLKVVEYLANYCRTRNKYLSDLALSEWQQFSPAFDADIYDVVAVEQSVGAYCSFGGSSQEEVEHALERLAEALSRDESAIEATSVRWSLEELWEGKPQ